MVQSSLDLKHDFLAKLEILKILSEKESIELSELASILGLHEWEVKDILSELRGNYMLVKEKSRVMWIAGDNPSRIKPWGWNYIYRTLVGSTMVSARYHPQWSIVIAEYQSKSYGRHGKQWISNFGGIWMTLKFEVYPKVAQTIPIFIPVAICRFLNERLSVKARIKWPNDIIVGERKLAGFLVEGEMLLSKISVYLGIGINVNNDPPIESAVSLKNIVGRLIPRNSMVAYIAGTVGKVDEAAADVGKLQMQYLDYLETLGRKVRLVTKKGVYIGLAKNITERGDLVVETDTGSFVYSSGEVLELRHVD